MKYLLLSLLMLPGCQLDADELAEHGLANGDVVVLASGGPKMTLDYCVSGNKCYCRWINNSGDLVEQWLPLEGIVKVE